MHFIQENIIIFRNNAFLLTPLPKQTAASVWILLTIFFWTGLECSKLVVDECNLHFYQTQLIETKTKPVSWENLVIFKLTT